MIHFTRMNIKQKSCIVLLLVAYMQTQAYQIITLFVHGIADSYKQSIPFETVTHGPLLSFNFACSTERFFRIKMPYCSLGQDNELQQLALEWKKINEQFPHADGFILIGVSRGASAIINFLATYKPNKVRAVILESPFDTIEAVIKHRSQHLGVPACALNYAIRGMFWQFDPHGILPLNVIHHITEDIPMLFVTVESDHSVPLESTHNLLRARRDTGHRHCHHLHLLQGRHGKIMLGPDATIYQDTVEAFYAHYGLPHNSVAAQRGMQQLFIYRSS